MSTYSIKDLEQLSGIKAHTLRIWEQRYNFINPKRTDTNIRFYDDQDLKLVLNVSLLKENGFKISKIAKMDMPEMQEEILRITERNLRYPDKIHALILAMIDLDEERFEKIMSTNILQLGFEKTMLNIIYPFMSKIGVLWQTGTVNPAQEHFISNLVRQKLIVAIDGQFNPGQEYGKKFLLFLPEGELHELSLLFCSYLLKSRQHRVVYLGQSLPQRDLELACDIHKPDYMLTIITSTPGQDKIQKYIDKLAAKFVDTTMLLSGYQVIGQDIQLPKNFTLFNRMDELINFIDEKTPDFMAKP